jgi:hypothetical protein
MGICQRSRRSYKLHPAIRCTSKIHVRPTIMRQRSGCIQHLEYAFIKHGGANEAGKAIKTPG